MTQKVQVNRPLCSRMRMFDGSPVFFFRYLRQVIDETMRCAVVAPWGARFQDFDSELGGHKIPKNVSHNFNPNHA